MVFEGTFMMTFTAKRFDALDFVDKSKELGVDEKVAKYQARQIEQAIEIAVNSIKADMETKELATKLDIKELELKLSAEIQKSKIDTILWVGGIMVSLLIANGIIQHFFK